MCIRAACRGLPSIPRPAMLVKKNVLVVVVATSLPQLATSASFDWAVRIGGSSEDVSEGIASDGAAGSLVAGDFHFS